MRAALSIALSLAALGFSVAVVVAAWSAPYKGFVAFTGQRIVEVDAGGPADRAGLEPGDRLVAIDGEPIRNTLGYAQRMLSREPGERVRVTVETPQGAERTANLSLRSSGPPIGALVASVLAAVLLGLGLVARIGRPDDVAAARFWRTAVVYAVAYAAVLSWSHLVVHPGLALAGLAAVFFVGPATFDFLIAFPSRPRGSMRGWRIAVWVATAVLLTASLACIACTVQDYRAGRSGDEAARWAVRFVTAGLGLLVPMGLGSVIYQYRNLRRTEQPTDPGQRGQLEWLLFGLALASVPAWIAVPFAAADIDWFLLRGYRPFAGAMAVPWFAGVALAVLRVRLADVDLVIGRSLAYALASGAAVGIYFAVALVVGLGAERVAGRGHVVTPAVAALVAAALFGPIRTRVAGWIDRRFFRDRVCYAEALRELSDRVRELREPGDLAREVIDHAVDALRASSGALYLDAVDDEGAVVLRCAHARGDGYPERVAADAPPEPPEGGVRVPIDGSETRGALVLGPRRGGVLYSSQDRDQLGALAGQLATAFDNARAFGTIAQMGRTLEQQNREVRELRDKLEDENRYLRQRLEASLGDDERIVGSSKAARELRTQIERAAKSDAVVLLTGETGTGKGLVARTIHAASERGEHPFIHVDCGAIPKGVFESELFGNERGAFTGAVRNRRGMFELAEGGTVFLDEIGELPLEMQPKLLRAVQERSFTRVGGSKPVTVDVRFVAATNRNLRRMIRYGSFREDLYDRLAVLVVDVPPLRARTSDVPELADALLPELCRRNHTRRKHLTGEALERLRSYGWPGNVGELENVLERAVVLSEGSEIGADEVALPESPPPAQELVERVDEQADASQHRDVMQNIERERIAEAMRTAGGNRSRAARALGMPRTTLLNKLRRYGLG